jgi:hypothetical protein
LSLRDCFPRPFSPSEPEISVLVDPFLKKILAGFEKTQIFYQSTILPFDWFERKITYKQGCAE